MVISPQSQVDLLYTIYIILHTRMAYYNSDHCQIEISMIIESIKTSPKSRHAFLLFISNDFWIAKFVVLIIWVMWVDIFVRCMSGRRRKELNDDDERQNGCPKNVPHTFAFHGAPAKWKENRRIQIYVRFFLMVFRFLNGDFRYRILYSKSYLASRKSWFA